MKFKVYGQRRYGSEQERFFGLFEAETLEDAKDMAYEKWNKNVKSWMHRVSVIYAKGVMKEFEEITIGMEGKDYNGNKGVVCAIGPAGIISMGDSMGTLKDCLDEGITNPADPAVLVETKIGTVAYVYGSDGFYVEN